MFLGIELVRDRERRAPDPQVTGEVIGELRRGGVLVGRGGRHGNVIRICPPLVIGDHELEAGLATIVEVLA